MVARPAPTGAGGASGRAHGMPTRCSTVCASTTAATKGRDQRSWYTLTTTSRPSARAMPVTLPTDVAWKRPPMTSTPRVASTCAASWPAITSGSSVPWMARWTTAGSPS